MTDHLLAGLEKSPLVAKKAPLIIGISFVVIVVVVIALLLLSPSWQARPSGTSETETTPDSTNSDSTVNKKYASSRFLYSFVYDDEFGDSRVNYYPVRYSDNGSVQCALEGIEFTISSVTIRAGQGDADCRSYVVPNAEEEVDSRLLTSTGGTSVTSTTYLISAEDEEYEINAIAQVADGTFWDLEIENITANGLEPATAQVERIVSELDIQSLELQPDQF